MWGGFYKKKKNQKVAGEQDGGDPELDQLGLLLHQHRLHSRVRSLSKVTNFKKGILSSPFALNFEAILFFS